MSIADKLVAIAENQQRVYDAGIFTAGYENGYGDGAGAVADGSIEQLKSDKVKLVAQGSFSDRTLLKSVYLPNVLYINNQAFSGCMRLTDVYIPKCTRIENEAFATCNIKKIDLPSVTYLGQYALINNPLEEIILRNTSAVIPMLESYTLAESLIGAGTGYVYVPRALVDSYKSATNWSAVADQIRAIEDYPEITGG